MNFINVLPIKLLVKPRHGSIDDGIEYSCIGDDIFVAGNGKLSC